MTRAAADAWAAAALPDPAVIGADEDAGTASAELASHWMREAERSGEELPAPGAELAAALSRRIRAHRGERGPGRPALPPEERRVSVLIRMRPEVRTRLVKLAARKGISQAALVERLIERAGRRSR